MYLILDTETTGLDPTSRIVSICWALFDASASAVAVRHHIIYPDGFTIPAEVAAIHGITTAKARRHGIPIKNALTAFYQDIGTHCPRLYVGHNVAFDRPIVLNEYRRLAADENLSPLPTFCTMESTTDICRLPTRSGGRGYPCT